MSFKKRVLLPFGLAFALLLSACGGEKEAAVSTPAPTPAAALSVRQYDSRANGISFEYPAGWSVAESGRTITIAPASGAADCGAVIADITREMQLFLAGHGDLISSVEALMKRHATLFVGDAELQNYQSSAASAGGEVFGSASFLFEDGGRVYTCSLEVTQTGGRVMLALFGRGGGTDEKNAELDGLYAGLTESLRLLGTEGELVPADLTELGFPPAEEGRFTYYNPITGQFLTIPEECDVSSGPYDSQVVIYSADHGLMITSNWTEPFNEIYDATNGDLQQCFAAFVAECIEAAEGLFGQKLLYRDVKFQTDSYYGELIKAAFYVDPDGESTRCFAELSARGDFVQGTFIIYNPENEEAGRVLFNSIMGTSLITFPDLG